MAGRGLWPLRGATVSVPLQALRLCKTLVDPGAIFTLSAPFLHLPVTPHNDGVRGRRSAGHLGQGGRRRQGFRKKLSLRSRGNTSGRPFHGQPVTGGGPGSTTSR